MQALRLFLAEQGDAYVLANIRGGGEYGPGWHKAALREKRQNAFDDLEAVARDLIRTGVARNDGVAISADPTAVFSPAQRSPSNPGSIVLRSSDRLCST